MPEPAGGWTDEQVDQWLGQILRWGVIVAGLVLAAGGVILLARHAAEPAEGHTFHGEPAELRDPAGIVGAAAGGEARGVIALGLLLLVATPVARVVFAGYAFLRERDWLYVAVAGFVLVVLLAGVFHL
jgi:uncharacterized membrane protein